MTASKDNKFNFTINALSKLPVAANGQRSYYYDQKVSALGIMVFPSGTKTFFVYKRVRGKPDKIKLGRFPEMSIEQARRAANACLTYIASGANPNQDKKQLRAELTFAELFHKYMQDYAKQHKQSWHLDQSYYNNHLQPLYNSKLSHIARRDIEKIHRAVKDKSGLYAANRVVSLIQKIFNKAIDWGYNGENPALRIQKFQEQARDRFVRPDEMARFFDSIEAEENVVIKSFFYLLLYTGARKRNVLEMRWQDLELGSEPRWRIPKTKNGEAHTVWLVTEAVEVLQRLQALDNTWVFPSKSSKSGHLEEPKSAWKRLLARAGIANLRIHDLRRTMASWQVRNGANSYIIGKTLGHKDAQATAVYAIASSDTALEHMSKAVKDMVGFAKKK